MKKNTNKQWLLLQVSIFVLLTGTTLSAHAEYYLVYPAPTVYVSCQNICQPVCYRPCVQSPIIYQHYESPRRHSSYGAEEMAAYEWIVDP
jgi:hypothetical protein